MGFMCLDVISIPFVKAIICIWLYVAIVKAFYARVGYTQSNL